MREKKTPKAIQIFEEKINMWRKFMQNKKWCDFWFLDAAAGSSNFHKHTHTHAFTAGQT